MTHIPDKSIEDTGERMVPAYHKGHIVYAEHIVRYEAVRALVAGKTVLDIASGSGYGTHLIAQAAKQVYGVDADKEAVRYASKNYSDKNVAFLEGSGTAIPLENNSVDIIVSFETIEHIEDYRTFMSEVKRVLKTDGLFVLSTPNDVEFPETNHFHIHEFKRKELEALAKRYFKNASVYYQGTWLCSGLFADGQLDTEWERQVHVMQTAPIKPGQSIYFYLLCSNRDITESIEPLAAIGEHYSERRRQEYDASVREHIKEQAAIIQHLDDLVRKRDEELRSIYDTKSWKVASRMRDIKGRIRKRR